MSILVRRIDFCERRGSQCYAKESFDRAESTNCSQHLSLGFPAWGKRGEKGVYSGAQQVLRCELCVVRGGGCPIMLVTPLRRWSPVNSSIVSPVVAYCQHYITRSSLIICQYFALGIIMGSQLMGTPFLGLSQPGPVQFVKFL